MGDGYVGIARSNPLLEYVSFGKMPHTELSALAMHCLNLRHFNVLDICGSPANCGAVLKALVTNCRRLAHLDIQWAGTGNDDVDDEEMNRDFLEVSTTAITTHCPQLQSFQVDNLSSDQLCRVAAGCPNLTKFGLFEASNVDDEALCAIARHCKKITHFDMRGGNYVTAAGMDAIAEGCRNLQSVIVNNNYSLTDEVLTKLALNSSATLTCVDLHGCQLITDDAMEAIAINCIQHTTLRVFDCPQITFAGLAPIATVCAHLHTLVTQCGDSRIDKFAYVIGSKCVNLERL